MTDRELMQQALEALKRYQVKRQDFDRFADEIASLREALAEPAPEPVAWMWDYKRLDGHVETKVIFAQRYSPGDLAYVLDGKNATPLYTAPPRREWLSLTDDERLEVAGIDGADEWFWKVVEAIEAKLKEKNT